MASSSGPPPTSDFGSAALQACAVCGSDTARAVAATCATCAEHNDGSGVLCAGCYLNHARRMGLFKSHKAEKLLGQSESLLSANGLSPVPSLCTVHSGKPIEFVCSSQGCEEATFCCSLCAFGAHKGHALALVAEKARPSQSALLGAAYAATGGTILFAPPVVVLPENAPTAAEGTPLVSAVRSTTLTVAAKLRALPEVVAAAEHDIDVLFDGILLELAERRRTLTAEVRSAAEAQAAALQRDLALLDGQLDKARTYVATALQVS
jgi:hypothetical protein